MLCPIGLELDGPHHPLAAPQGGDVLSAFGRTAIQQRHVGMLRPHLVERGPDRPMIVTVEPTPEGDPGALRDQHFDVRAAPSVVEVAR